MNLKNKKILVTGADGFIGSHLTEKLIRCGHDTRAFVYYNSFNSWRRFNKSADFWRRGLARKKLWHCAGKI